MNKGIYIELEKKMNGGHLIFLTEFGSRVYGTHSENSDTDLKGVYVASMEDTIHNRVKDSIHHDTNPTDKKNTPDDTDIELIELRKFINDACKGQTYALDMLFTPNSFWLYGMESWIDIVKNRDKFLSKNVAPFIGYARKQAAKYGLKGSRLGEVMRLLEYLKDKPKNVPVLDTLMKYPFASSEYIFLEEREHIPNGIVHKQTFLSVLGKMYAVTIHVGEIEKGIQNLYDQYGHRAKLAQENEGVDWKAISHAYRACYQLQDLANTGMIQFPLRMAEVIKNIKYGNIPYSEIDGELPHLMEHSISLVEFSDKLQDQPDREFWMSYITKKYKDAYGWS